MADSVHAASRTDCHAVFRTGDCRPVRYRNAYRSYHLAFADEALVSQNLLATFFLGGPRVPVFSNLCSKIFAWSYGQNRPKPEV